MKTFLPLFVVCFSLLGAARFFSLDAHWSSDEALWLNRSADFVSAVKHCDFSETRIAYHPGVPTMWIAGLRTFFISPGVDVENLAYSRSFIGLFVSAGLVISIFFLYQLFDRRVALASFASLAYSPLFLAQTRRVHTDALATIAILLTVLLFLLYCQFPDRRRYLVLSGISFGLAILSKSYALILFFWVPVCLFLFRENRTGGFWRQISDVLIFLNVTVITFVSVWPVFWSPSFVLMSLFLFSVTVLLLKDVKKGRVNPYMLIFFVSVLVLVSVRVIEIVGIIFESVHWALTTPHEVEHFFLGRVVNDPGWLFYPFVFMIKSTPLMLPLAICGVSFLWKRRKQSENTSCHFRMTLSLVACIILFVVCLSTTSKKFGRYLLPAFALLEILAGIGLVEGLKACYAWLVSRFGTAETAKYKTTLAIIACCGFFLIQNVPVLSLHPYYGTYYNLCWKVVDITKVITVGDASGLDIAAHYLNEKPNSEDLLVQVSPLATEYVRYYFRGLAYRSDIGMEDAADYEIVYIRDSQIGRVPQTGTLNGELEAVITLNGIDHVWIYKVR